MRRTSSAAAWIVTGARQALSIGIILMVISEMFAAKDGLGFSVVQFQRSFAIPEMWSGVILLGVVGVLLSLVFRAVTSAVLGWYLGTGSLRTEVPEMSSRADAAGPAGAVAVGAVGAVGAAGPAGGRTGGARLAVRGLRKVFAGSPRPGGPRPGGPRPGGPRPGGPRPGGPRPGGPRLGGARSGGARGGAARLTHVVGGADG